MLKQKCKGALIVALAALYGLVIGCPVYRVFGWSCPGCGMSRAFLAALRLDFSAAFSYHPLFCLFLPETAYVILRGKTLKIPDRWELAIGIVSLGLLIIVWIYRRFIICTI